MMHRDRAHPHLQKAEEYLTATRLTAQSGLSNAACSLAITSGINSKDVICLLSVGYSDKSVNHDSAVAELRRSGPVGAAMAPTLDRLLSEKTKSQYSPASVTRTDADDAEKRAARLFEAATVLFGSTPN